MLALANEQWSGKGEVRNIGEWGRDRSTEALILHDAERWITACSLPFPKEIMKTQQDEGLVYSSEFKQLNDVLIEASWLPLRALRQWEVRTPHRLLHGA